TEGGLDILSQRERVGQAVGRLQDAGIVVSMFLDPDLAQIEAAAAIGADAVELHTGQYALAQPGPEQALELATLRAAAAEIRQFEMTLHAGHGLTYRNVKPIAAIADMHELNIGHSIIARSIMVGLERAVREMKELIDTRHKTP
ncbi:unnamed protein product, partial [marine sediment metagenome]